MSQPNSPTYDGHLGKQFRDGLVLKPVVNFNAIDGKIPVLPDHVVNSLNNDSKYFYLICHAVQSGNCDQELADHLIGHVHQAR